MAGLWHEDPRISVSSCIVRSRIVEIIPLRLSLAAYVRGLGRNPSPTQQLKLIDKQDKLQSKINDFVNKAEQFLEFSLDEDDVEPTQEQYDGGEFDIMDPDYSLFADPEEDDTEPPEKYKLPLPSMFSPSDRADKGIPDDLVELEMKLRVGQANENLHNIRICISQKSFLFRNRVRQAKNSQQRKTRAWSEVTTVDGNLQQSARIYNQCRQALLSLDADEDLLNKYQVLRHADLKASTAIMGDNIIGNRSPVLSWLWKVDARGDAEDDWLQECGCLLIHRCGDHSK